jgi:hypothetical protein
LFRSGKYKTALWFFRQPILPFAVQLALLAPLILTPSSGTAAALYLFVAPWLLPLLGVVNLPFLVATFRAFRMDAATRRNHALEHATILFLEESSGRRFAGRSSWNGFHVVGPATAREIRTAFDRVRRVFQDGQELSYITPRCGSNLVTALGLGLTSLLLTAVATILFQPPLIVRAAALVAVVLVFVALRHGIGNAIQRRFFMRVDFTEVQVRDVRTARQRAFDRGPVHFVETIVLTAHELT